MFWFRKLKESRNAGEAEKMTPKTKARKSYYFSREDPASDTHDDLFKHDKSRPRRRRSSARSPNRVAPAVPGECGCRNNVSPPGYRVDGLLATQSSSEECVPEEILAPIVTKKQRKKKKSTEKNGNSNLSPGGKRHYQNSQNSPGIRLRTVSPRMSARRSFHRPSSSSGSCTSSGSVGSRSSSLAIVKSSSNPQQDFRESMLEMIAENKLTASKDLEDLLACYLSLNSDRYHDLIITNFISWLNSNLQADTNQSMFVFTAQHYEQGLCD